MARRRTARRARRAFGRVRSYGRRHKTIGGIGGDVIHGAVIGGAVAFGSPYIKQFVPALGPLSSTTVAVAGAGLAGKMLHKGGGWTNAALIVGSAMAAHDVMAGMGGGTTSAGVAMY